MNITLNHTISVKDYNMLRKAVNWLTLEEEQARRGIDNTYYSVCAIDGDKTIGMARVISDGGYVVYIADVIVLPEYQGKGVGQLIMEDVMKYIYEVISDGAPVMVNLMSAFSRESFYEQFGFVKRPTKEVGAGMFQWVNLNN
ncbi:GNAT family N-acetyltransferase [Anaerocolumna sp. MB42-C2]|uniref:GNAT family N-acetyltransferase n=1 Tax=Anaerocolumna sp. MB42-C2 TaxID=3070997 RepID=UPI0027E078CF|nr:GNAT family N-acetyltransferase [Anaerocolumna sp. MB42-C2]WMJ88281.1 GNAT family N-acetyltransferase [Anaerocolumna sp. MB42-C2]